MGAKAKRLIIAAAAGTVLLIACLWGGLALMQQRMLHAQQQEQALTELRGRIVHLDEVLTMSSRMAAVTGDLTWEDRYNQHVDPLDAAIKQLIDLSPATYDEQAGQQTDHANQALVAMEVEAFERVRAGQPEAAAALLFSEPYDRHKREYAEGMDRVAKTLKARLEAQQRRVRFDLAALGGISVLAVGIMLLGWGFLVRLVRRMLGQQEATLLEAQRDRRQLEAANHELWKLSLVVNNTDSAVIVTNAAGLVEYANPAFTRISGYTLDDARGQKPGHLLQGEETDPATVAMIRQRVAAGEGFETEIINYHKEGRKYWLHLEVRPVRNAAGDLTHFIAIERDITEQKRVQHALAASEERFKRITSNVPGMVYRFEADEAGASRFTFVSDGCREIYGVEPMDVLDAPGTLLDRIHPEDAPGFVEAVETSRTTLGGFNWTGRHVHPDGSITWAHAVSRPERLPGGMTSWDGVVTDITDRVRIEQQLAEARDLAEAASRAKSEFLANMSHEIRTPLNGILGFGKMLRDEKDREPADRRAWVQAICRSGNHLLSLINDILDLSKIEAGQLQIEEVDCDLGELLSGVMSTLRSKALERGVSLELELEGGVPASVHTDPTRLRQVLMNLVGNAIKFTHQGSVTIHAAYDEASNRVRFDVTDTGIGIPQNKLDAIFRPFEQADTSTTRKYGGTGLGLSISQRLAERLGGGLGVTSTPGRGSTFSMTIDPGDVTRVPRLQPGIGEAIRHDARGEPGPADANPADSMNAETGRKLKVLLVDDGPVNRMLIQAVLADSGMEVVEATNGEEAVAAVRHANHDETPFDLILMDMQMPVIDGYEATRQLREAGQTLPILALTAAAMKGDRDRCLAVGCDAYLSKPIEPADLLKTLRDTLDSRDTGRAAA